MNGVPGDVSGGGCVTGRPRGGPGGRGGSVAGGGMCGEGGGAYVARLHLTADPGPRGFDGRSGSVVPGGRLLEVRKHALGDVGRMQDQ